MIDIHNHIIFGVDDGPKTIDESLNILREAVDLGISEIIATPHFRRDFFIYSNNDMINNYNLLIEKINEENIDIKLHLGHEAYLTNTLLKDIQDGNCLTLAKSQYILVELPTLNNFYYIKKILFDLGNLNLTPIIAHCERLVNSKTNYKQLLDLKDMGCFLQVNASFIIGNFNQYHLRQWIFKQLSLEVIDFVASDSHNLYKRKNNLLEAKKRLANKISKERLELIFTVNPKRIINNESIL